MKFILKAFLALFIFSFIISALVRSIESKNFAPLIIIIVVVIVLLVWKTVNNMKVDNIDEVGENIQLVQKSKTTVDPITRIKKLQELKDSGVITEEEFNEKKKILMDQI